MKRIEVRLAAKSGTLLCTLISLFYTTSAFIWLVKGCQTTNIAGIIVPYPNTSIIHPSLYSSCNKDCKCSKTQYFPLCGSNGVTYYSACFAGCQSQHQLTQGHVFTNCSCVTSPFTSYDYRRDEKHLTTEPASPSSLSHSRTTTSYQLDNRIIHNYATPGKCERNCKNFYYFVVLVILTSVIGALGGIPHKMVVMRCVPDNHRSFALGMKTVIIRILTLPAPLVVGAFVDQVGRPK